MWYGNEWIMKLDKKSEYLEEIWPIMFLCFMYHYLMESAGYLIPVSSVMTMAELHSNWLLKNWKVCGFQFNRHVMVLIKDTVANI